MSKIKSAYKILPKLNLIIEYHNGIVDLDSFINFKIKLSNDALFSPNFNLIIYLKDVTFATTEADIKKYVDFLAENKKYQGTRKISVITKTPNQVVSSTLFKMMHVNPSQSIEIFSTIENAIKWFETNNLTPQKVRTIIRELKENIL